MLRIQFNTPKLETGISFRNSASLKLKQSATATAPEQFHITCTVNYEFLVDNGIKLSFKIKVKRSQSIHFGSSLINDKGPFVKLAPRRGDEKKERSLGPPTSQLEKKMVNFSQRRKKGNFGRGARARRRLFVFLRHFGLMAA